MDKELHDLIADFVNIKNVVCEIGDIINTIKHKLARLKEIHTDFIKDKDNNNKIFLICLESFHFQYKVMTVEMDNMQRNFMLLTNRTYCDYYNLYGILYKVFEDYNLKVPTLKNHPVYKDLEPFHEYTLEEIVLVHDNVTELIEKLINKFHEKEKLVNKYVYKSQSGFRIANLINTHEYETSVLKDKIVLYSNYCKFFLETQMKYFGRLCLKIGALRDEIDEEIIFRETPFDNGPIKEDDTLTQTCEELPVAQWKNDDFDSNVFVKEDVVVTEELVGISSEDLDNFKTIPAKNGNKNKNKKK
jgi:hypothetical protein